MLRTTAANGRLAGLVGVTLATLGYLTITGSGQAIAVEISAEAGFSTVQGLAGDWLEDQQAANDANVAPSVLTYEMVANGHTVLEHLWGMTTAYSLDGQSILATHYCSSGNQPRLRAQGANLASDALAFSFYDIAGRSEDEGYISGVKLFTNGVAAGKLIQEWSHTRADGTTSSFQIGWTKVEQHKITLERNLPFTALVVKRESSLTDFDQTLRAALRLVRETAAARGILLSGTAIARFDEFTAEGITFHAGIAFAGDASTLPAQLLAQGFSVTSLPVGDAASTIHKGTSETSGAAYEKLHGWMATNGRRPAGAPWEVYLSELETTQPERQLTKIIYPVNSADAP